MWAGRERSGGVLGAVGVLGGAIVVNGGACGAGHGSSGAERTHVRAVWWGIEFLQPRTSARGAGGTVPRAHGRTGQAGERTHDGSAASAFETNETPHTRTCTHSRTHLHLHARTHARTVFVIISDSQMRLSARLLVQSTARPLLR